MSSRPSAFKKGGGFLNNVDGVISDYQFTDEWNGKPFVPGRDPKSKKERFHSLYAKLSVRVDGADEDTTTTLFAGGYDDFDISEDGHVLTPVVDGHELGANTGWAFLIQSLCDAGFPDTNLPEDSIDFTAIIGTRARFVQRVNADMKAKGKKRLDKKTGKEWDYQDVVVDQVYDLPGKGAAAKSAKTAPAKGKATKPAVVEESGEDIQELSSATLLAILEKNDGTMVKSKLSLPILKELGTKHPQREAVRTYLADDANLAELAEAGVITFNKKNGQIAVAA